MSAETPNPQPGDRVRVTYEGTYLRPHDHQDGCHVVKVPDDTNTRVTLRSATVEVLERADDPSKDEVGTVRRSPDGKVVAKGSRINFPWANLSAPKGDDSYHSNAVAGWPVIGAVPGTPAAANDPAEFMRKITKVFRRPGESDADYQTRMVREGEAHEADGGVVHLGAFGDCEKCTPRPSVRVPNEPHGPAAGVLQLVREELTQGHALAAVNLLKRATGWSLDEAREYVESMSECQTYLNHHGGKREPREFTKDGPEPPEDVTLVHDYRAADHPMRFAYLGRRAKDRPDLWFWQHRNVMDEDEDLGGGGTWAAMTEHAAGPLREVL